ncbi:MAG: DNA ligase D [Amphiplicatus sp.]
MARKRSALARYQEMRDFEQTPEPKGGVSSKRGDLFLVQKHDARRLHYDFRLELDGVLKSWAVTKGPSLDPAQKRLAVRTEDHPVEYGAFEGVIPKGYGAGTVLLWDRGSWKPKGDPRKGLKDGALKFELDGKRLKGGFALIRMKPKKREKRENWLLVKERDEEANTQIEPAEKWATSVKSRRKLKAIEKSGVARSKTARLSSRKKRGGGTGKKSALAFTPPQLATLREAPPDGAEWLHELKYDGYRIQALLKNGEARLITRNEKNWTSRYPAIADAVSNLSVDSCAIDGELVAVDKNGRSDFRAMQNAGADSVALLFYAFDLLNLDGENLKPLPLIERKKRLKSLIASAGDPLRYSDHIEGDGADVIARACAMNLEGLVSKKGDAPYRSGRSRTWIKSKCVGRDEFVIVGYRKSDKRGRPFSSLLLGEYEGTELHYRGRVGTGFDEAMLAELADHMKPLVRKSSPLAETPGEARRSAVWLTPKLIAEIAYSEKTSSERLRHPSFLGLRFDKQASEVKMAAASDASQKAAVDGITITHPDRVLYEEQGVTKRALAEYFMRQAPRILPYLSGRPLSLVRCPEGAGGECFFQKHHNKSAPKEIGAVSIRSKEGKDEPYLVINDAKGLVAAAQIGALELHLWGARTNKIESPERLIFDLDPDEGRSFADVRDAAFEVRDLLQAAGLQSFALLTGGKGVHVIAPVERRREWSDIKTFCRGVARALEKSAPDRYVATASKAKRKNKIFVDWLRNERGATAVAPYSTRARKGAPVATPVSWKELKAVEAADQYTLENIDKRIAKLKSDPWADYFAIRQSVTKAMLDAVGSD